MVYPGVRERNGGWRGCGCIWLVAVGGVWGLKTAERGGDKFGKWCPGGGRAGVQRVLGEEEEVGTIAECCDSRLHSLHRAVGVRCSGWSWSRKGRWHPCRGSGVAVYPGVRERNGRGG